MCFLHICQIIIPVTFGSMTVFSGDARNFTSGRQQIGGSWFAVLIDHKVCLGVFLKVGCPSLLLLSILSFPRCGKCYECEIPMGHGCSSWWQNSFCRIHVWHSGGSREQAWLTSAGNSGMNLVGEGLARKSGWPRLFMTLGEFSKLMPNWDSYFKMQVCRRSLKIQILKTRKAVCR